MKIIWKRDNSRYSNGFLGYIGKWCCFNLSWGGVGRGDGPYNLSCYLPGIKKDIGNFDEKAGKEKATKAAEHWFKNVEEVPDYCPIKPVKMVRTKK